MSRREEYEQKTWDLLGPVLEVMHLIPVDVEFVKEGSDYFLRIFIDKDGGVGIDDCEAVSRAVDPLLDREDFIKEPYILEVSSPGLGRQLKRPRDFEYAMGREVEIRTYRVPEGRSGKEFRGILTGCDSRDVRIRFEETGEEAVFPRSGISLIRLAFDFE